MKHKGRIEETIRQVVAELLLRRVKDPRVANVSVTRVRTSKDLSVATILYNVIGGSEDHSRVQAGLESCRGFLRSQLKRHLQLRVTPDLVFRYDPSLDRAMAIEELLEGIHGEEDTGFQDEGSREDANGQ